MKGSPDLHGRPLLFAAQAELRGGHGGPVNSVAAGLGPDVEDGVANAFGAPEEELILRGDAEAECIHQRIAGVAGLEDDLAADGRTTEGVAVAADARDHAGDDPARLIVPRIREAKGIQQRDRPRAHSEDVPENAPHSGGGALVGLDERRMIVRLDLENGEKTVADVEGPRVLARSLGHPRPLGGQCLQMKARGLVRAMLRPHDREHPQLDQVRLAPEERLDAFVLVGFETMGFERLRIVHRGPILFGPSSRKSPGRDPNPGPPGQKPTGLGGTARGSNPTNFPCDRHRGSRSPSPEPR